MAIVGALVYLKPNEHQFVYKQLATLKDVSVHLLDKPNQMALVIEGKDLNHIHHLLTNKVATTNGVLAAYPVYTHFDNIENTGE